MPTNVRDPRTIVTPDAFEIEPALLGLPLAPPSRRLWALLIDLAIVGLLTAVLSSVQLLLWTVIGLALVRVASKKSGRSVSQAAGLLLRLSVGCLGFGILGIVAMVFVIVRLAGEPEDGVQRVVTAGAERVLAERLARAAREGDVDEVRALSGLELHGVDDADRAVAIFQGVLADLEDTPLPTRVKRQVLLASVPPDAPWAGRADSLVDVALARAEAGTAASADPFSGEAEQGEPAGEGGPGAALEAAVPVAELDAEAVLREFAALVEEDAEASNPRYRALRERLAGLVASDTLEALTGELQTARAALEEERRERRELEADLEESRSGAAALVSLLGDVWDQLGSAIGLWSIYFTALLTLWRGQTVGKRLMGVRVVRLDGSPIGWWPAFERAGGYVAGLATGLLGFAQVFWDPNRQCIHDKIVGTVVVDDRAERVPGAWQEAWTGPAPAPTPEEP